MSPARGVPGPAVPARSLLGPATLAPAAVALVTLALIGCESRSDRLPEDVEDRSRVRAVARTPEALMVRFRNVRGVGSERESWELEILQLGSDVRVRGAIRTAGTSIPIFHAMEPQEYVEFWQWLEQFPVDRARFSQDETQAEPGWRKSFDVDVVLNNETRLVSRNKWTRPLLDAAWVEDVEGRLHTMALNLAHAELDRMESGAAADVPAAGAPPAGGSLEPLGGLTADPSGSAP